MWQKAEMIFNKDIPLEKVWNEYKKGMSIINPDTGEPVKEGNLKEVYKSYQGSFYSGIYYMQNVIFELFSGTPTKEDQIRFFETMIKQRKEIDKFFGEENSGHTV